MAVHVNPETGKRGKCVGADRCAFKSMNDGAGIPHFETNEEADVYIEVTEAEKNKSFNSVASGVKQIDARINSDEYVALVADRDAKREESERLIEEYNELKEKYKKEKTTEEHKGEMQELAERSREAYLDLVEAKRQLQLYQEETAEMVKANIQPFETEYKGDTLGDLNYDGEYESGSKEWLMNRQGQGDEVRIGGSDVGSILELDPERKYALKNAKEVLESKVNAYEEDQEVTFYQDKGNTWEPYIVNKFAENHPEYEIMHSKATWTNKDNPDFTANFDGLISSKRDGKPDGILEIKTSSDARKWQDEDGNPKVPDNYRAQVLWYLHNSGMDYAHLAVAIDDNNYQEFRIERGEKIRPQSAENKKLQKEADAAGEKIPPSDEVGTIEEELPKIRAFQDTVRKARAEGIDSVRSKRKRNPNPRGNLRPPQKTEMMNLVATMQQRPIEDIRKAVRDRKRLEGLTDHEAIAKEMKSQRINLDNVIALDVEATGFSPRRGSEVIELGYQRLDKDGNVKEEFNKLYAPDPRFSNSNGTGAEDIHGISMDDVKGKPMFKDPKSKAELSKVFGKEATIIAHHAAMERTFLEHEFPETKFTFIDTETYTKFFDTTENNKMASFTEANGIKYEDAHRALADTDMMRRALLNGLGFGKNN